MFQERFLTREILEDHLSMVHEKDYKVAKSESLNFFKVFDESVPLFLTFIIFKIH